MAQHVRVRSSEVEVFAGRLSVAKIQQIVAREFNVALEDLLSVRRSRHVSEPRQIAMYLARKFFPQHSLSRLAKAFRRDPTTVKHACDVVMGRMTIPEVRLALWRIESALMDLSPDRSKVEAQAVEMASSLADAYRKAIFTLALRDPERFLVKASSLFDPEIAAASKEPRKWNAENIRLRAVLARC